MYVFLHGFTGAPSSWDVLGLPGLAPALPGHGGPEVASWDEAVDRIAAVSEGAHLVGYSLGARLALGVLARHPGLAARATLIGVNPGADDRPARVAWEESLARMLEREGLERFVGHWEGLPMWQTQRALPEEVRAAQRAIRRSHDPAGLAHSLRVLGLGRMPDLRPSLAGIDVPVDLVVGAEDARFLAIAEGMTLPRGSVHIVPGVGHNVLLEAPAALKARLTSDG